MGRNAGPRARTMPTTDLSPGGISR
jgi:hypothetical protein